MGSEGSIEPAQDLDAFRRFLEEVRVAVDRALARALEERVAAAALLATDLRDVEGALQALVLRGGKRFRAALTAVAYEGAGGEGGWPRVLGALVSFELLQGYLLIHDDWMDEDDVRRGGPSVHAALRKRFGSDRDGDVGAILAGDLACAYAQAALLEVPLPPERLLAAARELAGIQVDVIHGQLLDTRAGARAVGEVEAMHALKTGSYTVRGPLRLGALLAGQNNTLALDAFAAPLGVAFQLRDDLLGAFGDPERTGKPRGGDFRQGKRTSLVLELEATGAGKDALAKVLGDRHASDADVARLVTLLIETGARARVEERLDALLQAARARLDDAALGWLRPHARAVLRGAIVALGDRER